MDKLGIPLYLGLQTVNFNKEKDKYLFEPLKPTSFISINLCRKGTLVYNKSDLITSRVTFELMIFGKNCSHKIVLPDT